MRTSAVMLSALQIWVSSATVGQEAAAAAAAAAAAVPLEIVGGVAGAAAASIVFATFGAGLAHGGGEDPGLREFVIGGFIGTLIGSSAGVATVGHLTGDSGRFGAALLGSSLGLGAFLLMTPFLDADNASFYVALWGVPAAGATLAYGLSDRERPPWKELRAGSVRMIIAPQLNGRSALRGSISF